MNYEEYLEQAKKYVKKNNKLYSAYEDYFARATDALNKSYDSSLNAINSEYASDTNAAAAKSKLDAKNTAQYMAARGLARSGEAEQEAIGSNLSLNSVLAELTGSKNKALAAASSERNSGLLSLEKDRADKATEADRLADEYASAIANAQMSLDTQDKELAAKEKAAEAEREYGVYLRRLEAELEQAAAESERAYRSSVTDSQRAYDEKQRDEQRAYDARVLEESRAYDEALTAAANERADRIRAEEQELKLRLAGMNKDDGQSESAEFTPEQKPESLAAKLIGTYTENGKTASTVFDCLKLHDYIVFLKKKGISETYLEKLNFALSAYDYTEPTDSHIAMYENVASSRTVYDYTYNIKCNAYLSFGIPEDESKQIAAQAALDKQLDYCYRKCHDLEEFRVCCEIIGVTPFQYQKYLDRVEMVNRNDSFEKIELAK